MIEEQPLAALGDLGEIGLVDFLVLVRERRLLALAEGLRRIEAQLLPRQPRSGHAPLTVPIGIALALDLDLRARPEGCQYCRQGEHRDASCLVANQGFKRHRFPPSRSFDDVGSSPLHGVVNWRRLPRSYARIAKVDGKGTAA